MECLIEEVKARNEGFQQRCSTMLYNLLLDIAQIVKTGSISPSILETLSKMERNLDRQLSIHDLCRCANASPATLNRNFRKCMKIPPMEYFIRMKMDAACKMLRHTTYSIKQIAALTGYTNQLYFSSEFRKRLGVSPKAYRRGCMEQTENIDAIDDDNENQLTESCDFIPPTPVKPARRQDEPVGH